MKYRDIIGYSDKQPKKKVVKKQPKPSVTEGLKKQFGDTMNEGPAYEYAKFVKKIDKQRDQVGNETLKFVDLLRKKGLDDAADDLLDSYKNNVITFGKDLKQLIRKLV